MYKQIIPSVLSLVVLVAGYTFALPTSVEVDHGNHVKVEDTMPSSAGGEASHDGDEKVDEGMTAPQPVESEEGNVQKEEKGTRIEIWKDLAMSNDAEATVTEKKVTETEVVSPVAPQPVFEDCSLKMGVEKDACLLKQAEDKKEAMPGHATDKGGVEYPK